MKATYVIFAVLIALGVMVGLFQFGVEYSVLGFLMIAWAFLEFTQYVHGAVIWRRVDEEGEVQCGNMAVAIVIVARYIALAIIIGAALMAVPKATGAELELSNRRGAIDTSQFELPRHVEVMLSWVGVTETAPNRNWLLDIANPFCHVPKGSANCASVLSYALHLSGAKYPPIRSARARAFITKESIALPAKKLPDRLCGWLLIFERRGGGHIGTFADNRRTVEANTSSGERGSQHDGDGIWVRWRDIKKLSSPYNVFRATHITPVRYA